MEWQVCTYDSCQHWKEEGRGGSKKQELSSFPISSPCRQLLDFIGRREEELVRQSLLFPFL